MRLAFVGLAAFLLAFPAFGQEAVTIVPDPVRTPGAFDLAASRDSLCHAPTKHLRRPSSMLCNAAFAAYGIDPKHRYEYECDHLVPISLGGATVIANLWPQPNAEAKLKDKLERKLKRLVCKGVVSLPDARTEIASNWLAAYAKYVKR